MSKAETGFANFYRCPECKTAWEDEWSCACNDECPGCGLKDIEPYESHEHPIDPQAAVERVVSFGESFLTDWIDNEGKHDPDCERQGREFEAGKPLCLASPALLAAAKAFVDACGGNPPDWLRAEHDQALAAIALVPAS